jgi:hypothetical protein
MANLKHEPDFPQIAEIVFQSVDQSRPVSQVANETAKKILALNNIENEAKIDSVSSYYKNFIYMLNGVKIKGEALGLESIGII